MLGPTETRDRSIRSRHSVGAEGFGPSSSRSRIGCSAGLSYAPYVEVAALPVTSTRVLQARLGRSQPVEIPYAWLRFWVEKAPLSRELERLYAGVSPAGLPLSPAGLFRQTLLEAE